MIRRARLTGGFTLIELIIVIAVLSIITAVALPTYSEHVARTRRGAAQGCVGELSQFLERNYNLALRYDQDSGGGALVLPNLQCRTDLNGFFTFAAALAQGTYTLTATPAAKQANSDKRCGCAMTLNHQGIKGVSGCSKSVADCWK